MNSDLQKVAGKIKDDVLQAFKDHLMRLNGKWGAKPEEQDPENFSDEAIIKLVVENNFDDNKASQALFEKLVRVIHNKTFK
jgi:hypothetical protein